MRRNWANHQRGLPCNGEEVVENRAISTAIILVQTKSYPSKPLGDSTKVQKLKEVKKPRKNHAQARRPLAGSCTDEEIATNLVNFKIVDFV